MSKGWTVFPAVLLSVWDRFSMCITGQDQTQVLILTCQLSSPTNCLISQTPLLDHLYAYFIKGSHTCKLKQKVTWKYTGVFQTVKSLGWRDGSEVKSSYCSCREDLSLVLSTHIRPLIIAHVYPVNSDGLQIPVHIWHSVTQIQIKKNNNLEIFKFYNLLSF